MIEPVSLLTGLLERYSPTLSEGQAVTYLIESMRQLGFQSHVDPAGNAVGTIGSGPNEILLLGHIDTVVGEIQIRQEDGNLYGRGSVDAKGPLASFVCAASSIGLFPEWRITVIGAVGEESDSRGAQYLCEHYPAPAAVVIGEPSGWNSITLGYKGTYTAELTFRQAASHTASGKFSACDQAVQFWAHFLDVVNRTFQKNEKVFDQLSPSIRRFESTSNGFEDQAVLRINIRLPQQIDLSYLKNLLDQTSTQTGFIPEITDVDYLPAYLSGKNNFLVRSFLFGIRQMGGTPGFKLKSGTADMNLVGPAWNCPIVAYGPGDSNLDHTANEHIQIVEFLKGIDVLKATLQKIQDSPIDREVMTQIAKDSDLDNSKKLAKDKKPDKVW